MKKYLQIIAAFLSIVTLVACSNQRNVDEEIKLPIISGDEITIKTTPAKLADLTKVETVKTAICFPYATNVMMPVDGVIAASYVSLGQKVKHGDLLIQLDDKAIQAEITQQKRIVQNTSGIDKEIETAKLEILQSKAEQHQIRAPFDGMIVAVNNSTVNSHYSKYTDLFQIDRLENAYFQTITAAPEILRFGFNVDVTIDDKTYAGTVIDTLSIRKSEDKKVVIKVPDFSLANMDYEVINKMKSIPISYVSATRKNVLVVPADSVYSFSSSNYVNIYRDGVKIEMEVTTGITADGQTEITGGISPSDEVIVKS